MRRDIALPKINSTFLECEKEIELIIRKLLVETKPHSDILKKLLIINEKDCLEDSTVYKEIIDSKSVGQMIADGYIILVPRLEFEEHEEVKSYIIISFDNFTTNATNPKFRDHIVTFDIICNTKCWDLGNYRLRPLKIAGYIDGILNGSKLSGIGTFQFMGCNELILNEELSGYTLMYQAINGSDQYLEIEEIS